MRTLVTMVVATTLGTSAVAQGVPNAPPAVLQNMLRCRDIQGDAERLRCFDTSVAAFAAAEQQQQVLVVDKDQVRRAKRGLFGFSLPSFGSLFGGGGDKEQRIEEEEITRLESTIRSARMNGDRRLVLVLEDGARWVQTDVQRLAREPKAGQKIAIRRAALGSYFANIDGQTAIRVRREQ